MLVYEEHEISNHLDEWATRVHPDDIGFVRQAIAEHFAFVASHDLQEPLRKIKIFGDRLKTTCGETLTEQGRDYLERMQNAASRHADID